MRSFFLYNNNKKAKKTNQYYRHKHTRYELTIKFPTQRKPRVIKPTNEINKAISLN